jgi:phospholipid/cholesterol/gamma-HCH transport system ATP-binding protein
MSALVVDHLSVTLGGQRVLTGASAAFDLGERHAVIGRSGAGKSVLMKASTGLLPLTSGTVTLEKLTANASSPEVFATLRQRVAFVHQDPALLDDISVRDNVRFVAERRRVTAVEAETDRWLEALALEEVQHERPPTLSPGRLRKVAIARALCTRPDVLIVDEPTTGLDPRAAREVDDALASLRQDGATLIVITHDLRSLDVLEPSLCWVHDGSVRWQGAWTERHGQHPALDALLTGRPFDDAVAA